MSASRDSSNVSKERAGQPLTEDVVTSATTSALPSVSLVDSDADTADADAILQEMTAAGDNVEMFVSSFARLLAKFSDNASVLERAASSVRLRTATRHAFVGYEKQLGPLLLAAVNGTHQNLVVVEIALRCMCSIVVTPEDRLPAFCAELFALFKIIIINCKEYVDVARYCCGLLYKLVNIPEYRNSLVDEEMMALMYDLACLHSQDAVVVQGICFVVASLSFQHENRRLIFQTGFASLLEGALHAHFEDVTIVRCACSALNSLAPEEYARPAIFCDTMVQILTNVLQRHGEDVEVVRYVCSTASILPSDQQSHLAAVGSTLMSLFLRAMSSHKLDVLVCRLVWRAFCSLSQVAPLRPQILKDDVIRPLFASFRIQAVEPEVVACACVMLSSLSEETDICPIVVNMGVISALADVAANYVPIVDFVQRVCSLLNELTFLPRNRVSLPIADALHVLRCALECQGCDAVVCQCASSALANITLDVSHRVVVLDSALFPLLKGAINTHCNNARIVQMVCTVMCNLTSRSEHGERVIADDFLSSLARAIVLVNADVDAILWVCSLLCNLTSDPKIARIVASTELPLLLKSVMRTHDGHAPVVHRICGIMCNLAGKAGLASTIVDLDLLPLLRAAMMMHPDHFDIISCSCTALMEVTIHSRTRSMVVTENFLAVFEILWTRHEGNAPVMALLCTIVNNLALSPDLRPPLVHEGGLLLLKSALVRNPNDATVVESACSALRHIGSDSRFVDAVSKEDFLRVLCQSMSSHCKNRSIVRSACSALCCSTYLETEQTTEIVPFLMSALDDVMVLYGQSDGPIVRAVCGILCNLTAVGTVGPSLSMPLVVSFLRAAFAFHAADVEIMRVACSAAYNLSLEPSHRACLREKGLYSCIEQIEGMHLTDPEIARCIRRIRACQ